MVGGFDSGLCRIVRQYTIVPSCRYALSGLTNQDLDGRRLREDWHWKSVRCSCELEARGVEPLS